MIMGAEPLGSTQQFTYLPPTEKPWDKHRRNSQTVEQLYDSSDLTRYAERIRDCSRQLIFALESQDAGESKLRLRSARFCRVRHCPVCQWRRSLVWRARFFRAVPKVLEAHPGVNWIFLTLTVRNCPIEGLRDTVDGMNKAWKRLTLRKQFPAIGYVRSLEVTRSRDGTAHPHFHVLMVVAPSYFKGSSYVSQAKWTELWQSCLKVGYTPIVNVKAVKPKKGTEGTGIEIAVLETLKYGVKEDDLIADAFWLAELTKQLHKTRAISVSGILKDFIKEEEPEDLVNTDEDSIDSSDVDEEDRIIFGWLPHLKRYVQALEQ